MVLRVAFVLARNKRLACFSRGSRRVYYFGNQITKIFLAFLALLRLCSANLINVCRDSYKPYLEVRTGSGSNMCPIYLCIYLYSISISLSVCLSIPIISWNSATLELFLVHPAHLLLLRLALLLLFLLLFSTPTPASAPTPTSLVYFACDWAHHHQLNRSWDVNENA